MSKPNIKHRISLAMSDDVKAKMRDLANLKQKSMSSYIESLVLDDYRKQKTLGAIVMETVNEMNNAPETPVSDSSSTEDETTEATDSAVEESQE